MTFAVWAAVAIQAIALVSANAESRAYHQHHHHHHLQHSSPNAVAPSNYIITSKPFTVRDDADAGTVKWRRDTITGASLIGASDPAKAKYSIECADNNECAGIELGGGGSDATFKPYTQDELNRILKRYGEADSESESSDKILSYDDGGNQDKSKASWNLVQQQDSQQNSGGPKNPYDDRRGWVTLEPMAWSSSHIQKWEPNNRPTWPPPPQDHGGQSGYSPWASNRPVQRPSGGGGGGGYQQPQQQHHSDWTTERPWIRPTYDYSPKPQYGGGGGGGSHYSPKPPTSHGSQQSFYGWNNNNAEQDIITDGKPGQFPADAYHKPWNGGGDYGQTAPSYGPRPTEAEGDGQWVLLSSTKGYSIPHRPNRRSLARSISVDAVNRPAEATSSSKRTVRLMVLPPDKDSQNVTTSHGGMIQVDVSGKSVDQEQREYAAARALKGTATAVDSDVQVFAADRSTGAADDDRRAVLAAVSAGMLPAATMAMFLPMMVASRKRRDLPSVTPEVILHHHLYPR